MFRNRNQSMNSVDSNQGLLQSFNTTSSSSNQFNYVVSEKDSGYLQTSLDVLASNNKKKKRTVHQRKFQEFNELKQQQQQQYNNTPISSLHPDPTLSFTESDIFYQQQLQQQQQIIHQYTQQQQYCETPQKHLRSPTVSPFGLHTPALTPRPSSTNTKINYLQDPLRLSLNNSTSDSIYRYSGADRDDLIERLVTENNGLHQQLSENEVEMLRLFDENQMLKQGRMNGSTESIQRAIENIPTTFELEKLAEEDEEEELDKTIEALNSPIIKPAVNTISISTQTSPIATIIEPVKQITNSTSDLTTDLLETIRLLKLQNSQLTKQKYQIEEKLETSKKLIKKISGMTTRKNTRTKNFDTGFNIWGSHGILISAEFNDEEIV